MEVRYEEICNCCIKEKTVKWQAGAFIRLTGADEWRLAQAAFLKPKHTETK